MSTQLYGSQIKIPPVNTNNFEDEKTLYLADGRQEDLVEDSSSEIIEFNDDFDDYDPVGHYFEEYDAMGTKKEEVTPSIHHNPKKFTRPVGISLSIPTSEKEADQTAPEAETSLEDDFFNNQSKNSDEEDTQPPIAKVSGNIDDEPEKSSTVTPPTIRTKTPDHEEEISRVMSPIEGFGDIQAKFDEFGDVPSPELEIPTPSINTLNDGAESEDDQDLITNEKSPLINPSTVIIDDEDDIDLSKHRKSWFNFWWLARWAMYTVVIIAITAGATTAYIDNEYLNNNIQRQILMTADYYGYENEYSRKYKAAVKANSEALEALRENSKE